MDKKEDLVALQKAPLKTPSDIAPKAVKDITGALNALLADVFALYLKTKSFHWHMSGPHFRDYHLLLDDHGDQIFAMTDDIAERARKIGGTTIRSIGHIARLQRISDNDAEYVTAPDMLASYTKTKRPSFCACAPSTRYAMTLVTWPPPAYWKTGSIKLSAGVGSFLRPHGDSC
jgi:starvation-inducible DNA-binding protein